MIGRWSLAVLCIVACGPVVPPLPSRGGPVWVEIQSAHFTLWTDAPVERGQELVRELERRRQVITLAMNATSNAMTFVIAPRSRREMIEYVRPQFIGKAWPAANPSRRSGILFAANTSDDRDHIVAHELAHAISYGILHNQPSWLAEGIATYFEMIDVSSGDASVEIGVPREDRIRYLHGREPLGAEKLFACNPDTCALDSTPPAGQCSPICSMSTSPGSVAICKH
jgi:hypothetical protein